MSGKSDQLRAYLRHCGCSPLFVIFTGDMTTHRTKDGRPFTIRRPEEADARAIIDYSNLLFASTDQVLTMPEEYTMTLDQEKVWIDNGLQMYLMTS